LFSLTPQPRRIPLALSYFNAQTGGVNQLWVTDGTVAGTHSVFSFGAGAVFSHLATLGARAFFSVNDGVHGDEL
jgi:ELWxxDGT repeat protein